MVDYKWALSLFAGVLLLTLGCNTVELPEPTDGDPVFALEGNIGAEGFEIAAGVDAYFMFTALTPNSDGPLKSLSRLEELDCITNCAPGWQFEFNGSPAMLDSIFLPGSAVPLIRPGTVEVDTIQKLVFSAFTFHTGGFDVVDYEWAFSDGSVANTPTVEKSIFGNTIYEVELTTTTFDECQSYTRKTISTESGEWECEVGFNIDTTGITADTAITAFYDFQFGQAESLIWQDSIPGEVVSLFPPQSAEGLTICLEGLFNQSCSASSCQTVVFPLAIAPPYVCNNDILAEVIMETDSIMISGPANGVTIRYQDEQGNIYASDIGLQNGEFSFSVLSAEPFERNDLDQPTLRLGVQFQCQLFDNEGVFWQEAVGEGWIAVAVPE